MKTYAVKRAVKKPALDGNWDSEAWKQAATLEIAEFLEKSSAHRPRTQARLLHGDDGLFGIFRVEDRYVRCVRTTFQDQVCKDSCVEFFVVPKPGQAGYFNFEFNCGGTFLCYYITDPSRHHRGPSRKYVQLTEEDASTVRIFHSMPRVVDPEVDAPTTWCIEFFIPYALFERYAGAIETDAGAQWEGNFYKCADETSHPHWGCWSRVDEHNFHVPHCFGRLVFE